MKFKLFSVYDSKANAFLPPFVLAETGMAKRAFSNCANDVNHQFGRNPEDFTLYRVGGFDDEFGAVDRQEPFDNLGLAASYVKDRTVVVPTLEVNDAKS